MNDKQEFIEAVENDEYAEYRLETGDIIITDVEGDGVFNPYVEMGDHGDDHPTDILDEVASVISREFDVRVMSIEYDQNNGVLVPDMDRPE